MPDSEWNNAGFPVDGRFVTFPANGQFEVITPGPVILAAAEQDAQHFLKVGGAEIEVDIHLESSNLGADDVLAWVRSASEAVTVYYGQFPVRHARGSVTQNRDNDRSIHGTTWGDVDGFQGVSRMRLGRAVSKADLDADWTMTHELTHLALSSLPDKTHWLEEGLATYVEPIARAQDGQLSAAQVWHGMVGGMPHGQPGIGNQRLDETHTWGRTYWGGAMFCLVADAKIRQATGNRKSLQDALRAIVAAGATIDTEWPLSRILRVGDQATGHLYWKICTIVGRALPLQSSSINSGPNWEFATVPKGSKSIRPGFPRSSEVP